MSKKIKNNLKPILMIVLAVVFAILLIVPVKKIEATSLPDVKAYGPGGFPTCYCMVVPWDCGCIYWK